MSISVLLPTRGRPEGFARAVRSLVANASNLDDIELIVRYDSDDYSALEYVHQAHGLMRLHCIGKPRVGYRRIHEMWNELAEAAKGRWLFVWNDDTEMLTRGWDQLVESHYDERRPIIQFMRRDTLGVADTTFPIVDRRIYEAVGRMGAHAYTDTWLDKVSASAGVQVLRNDIVFHHYQEIDDQTKRENLQAMREVHGAFAGMVEEREADAQKVRELVARLAKESGQ